MPVLVKLNLQLSHVFSLGLLSILLHSIVNSSINFHEYFLYFFFEDCPEIGCRTLCMAYWVEFQPKRLAFVFFQFVFAYKALFSHQGKYNVVATAQSLVRMFYRRIGAWRIDHTH